MARAWQSLIRVISHKINNSLTPIISISQTLAAQIAQRDNASQARVNADPTIIEQLLINLIKMAWKQRVTMISRLS